MRIDPVETIVFAIIPVRDRFASMIDRCVPIAKIERANRRKSCARTGSFFDRCPFCIVVVVGPAPPPDP